MARRYKRPRGQNDYGLRDYQMYVVDQIENTTGKVVMAPCGSGKTRIAIALSDGRSTLYISNNNALGKQLEKSMLAQGIPADSIIFYSEKSFAPGITNLKHKTMIASYAGVCCDQHTYVDEELAAGVAAPARVEPEADKRSNSRQDAKQLCITTHVWDLIVFDEAWHCTHSRMQRIQELKARKVIFMSGDYEKAQSEFRYIQVWMLLYASYPGAAAAVSVPGPESVVATRFQLVCQKSAKGSVAAEKAQSGDSWQLQIENKVRKLSPENERNKPIMALLELYWTTHAVRVPYHMLVSWEPFPMGVAPLALRLEEKQEEKPVAPRRIDPARLQVQRPVTAVVPVGLWMPRITGWHDMRSTGDPVQSTINPLRLSLVWALVVHHAGQRINWERKYRGDRLVVPVVSCGPRAIALFCLSVPAHAIWTAAFSAIPLSADAAAEDVLSMLMEMNRVREVDLRPGKTSPLAVMSMSKGVGLNTTTARVGISVSSNHMNFKHMEIQQQGRVQRANTGPVSESEGSIYVSIRSPTGKSIGQPPSTAAMNDEDDEDAMDISDEPPTLAAVVTGAAVGPDWNELVPSDRFVDLMGKLPALLCHSEPPPGGTAVPVEVPRTMDIASLFPNQCTQSFLTVDLQIHRRLFRAIFEAVICRVDYAHQHATDHMRHVSVGNWADPQAASASQDPHSHTAKSEDLTAHQQSRWTQYLLEFESIGSHITCVDTASAKKQAIGGDGQKVPLPHYGYKTTVPLASWEIFRTVDGHPDYTDQWWRVLYPRICEETFGHPVTTVDEWYPCDETERVCAAWLERWQTAVRPERKTRWQWQLAMEHLNAWWDHTFQDFPLGTDGLSWKDIRVALYGTPA
jgi:hypothetical protein